MGMIDGFGMKVTRLGGLQFMTVFRDICQVHNGLGVTLDEAKFGAPIASF